MEQVNNLADNTVTVGQGLSKRKIIYPGSRAVAGNLCIRCHSKIIIPVPSYRSVRLGNRKVCAAIIADHSIRYTYPDIRSRINPDNNSSIIRSAILTIRTSIVWIYYRMEVILHLMNYSRTVG